MKRGFPMDSQPTFSGWKPSTSFAGLIELITFWELICSGSGIWTRIPWNFEFELRLLAESQRIYAPELLIDIATNNMGFKKI